MIHKKEGEIEWVEFELLQGIPSLKHGTFLRHGGVSCGVFSSLNVGGSTGDNPEHVEENRKRVLSLFPKATLVSGLQIHSANVDIVKGPYTSQEGCDGLITQEKHRALMIKHADCQSAIFYDPIKKLLANVHCGWRGNVQNIYERTIEKLKQLGSDPANLLVCISPSLGPNRSEFINFKVELPEHFQEFQWKENYFNLWEISRMQLRKAGILSTHIECAEICTYESKEDYFSHRRDQLKRGNNATVAMLC